MTIPCPNEPPKSRVLFSKKLIMSIVTTLLRFIFGVVLAGGLAIWVGLPFPAEVIFILSVGVVAAVWGDDFLMKFMSLMRYLR